MSKQYSIADTANYIRALTPTEKTACKSALKRFTDGMAAKQYGSLRGDLEKANNLIEKGKARFESQSGGTTQASRYTKMSPPPTVPESEGTPDEQAKSANQQTLQGTDQQSNADTLTQG